MLLTCIATSYRVVDSLSETICKVFSSWRLSNLKWTLLSYTVSGSKALQSGSTACKHHVVSPPVQPAEALIWCCQALNAPGKPLLELPLHFELGWAIKCWSQPSGISSLALSGPHSSNQQSIRDALAVGFNKTMSAKWFTGFPSFAFFM